MDDDTTHAGEETPDKITVEEPLSKGRLRKRLMMGHIVVFAVAIVVTLTALAMQLHTKNVEKESDEITALAKITAANIQSKAHQELAQKIKDLFRKDPQNPQAYALSAAERHEEIVKLVDSPEYREIREKFETVKRSAKSVAHVRTLVKIDEGIAAVTASDEAEEVGVVVHHPDQPGMGRGFTAPTAGHEKIGEEKARAGYAPISDNDAKLESLVAVSLRRERMWDTVAGLGWIWLLPLAVGLGLSALMAWRQSQKIMAPLKKTAEVIQRLSSGDMSARLSPTDARVTRVLRKSVMELGSSMGRHQRISAYYGRTLTGEMMGRIMEAGEEKLTEIARRRVTLVRVDILIPLTPKDGDAQFLEVINAASRIAIQAVLDNGGSVEDLDGHAVLGIFGSPLPVDNHLQAALQAAGDIRSDLGGISARRKREGMPLFDLRVWLHTGEVTLGLVGIPDRGEYRALGDPVDAIRALRCPEGVEITGPVVTEAAVGAGGLAAKALPAGVCETPSGQIKLYQMR